MTERRDPVSLVLERPSERAVRGILRNCLIGAGIGLVLIARSALQGSSGIGTAGGDLLAGLAIALLGWGADRLWFSTVARMAGRPFSAAAYLTRIPFWYFAGAIAYTAALLAEKKTGMRFVEDIPVKRLFAAGGLIGVAAQIPVQLVAYRSIAGKLKALSQSNGSGREIL